VSEALLNMSLETLPVEILIKIFDELAGEKWRGWGYGTKYPLASLSLSCRLFYDIAKPILYQGLSIQDIKPFSGFLKAVARRPSSADYVKCFSCPTDQRGHPGYREDTQSTLNMSYLTRAQRKWMRNCLPDDIHGRQSCDEWHQKLLCGRWDAMVGFLVHLFSRSLQELTLFSPLPQVPYLWPILERSASDHGQEALSKLRSVTLDYDGRTESRHNYLEVSFISPFLRLKSVTSITIGHLQSEVSPNSRFEDARVGPNNTVTDLRFTHCYATGALIRSLLLCFYSLRSFHYSQLSSEWDRHYTRTYPQLDPEAIVQGLANSKECLVSFELKKEVHGPNVRAEEFLDFIVLVV
jgi:F-box-like